VTVKLHTGQLRRRIDDLPVPHQRVRRTWTTDLWCSWKTLCDLIKTLYDRRQPFTGILDLTDDLKHIW